MELGHWQSWTVWTKVSESSEKLGEDPPAPASFTVGRSKIPFWLIMKALTKCVSLWGWTLGDGQTACEQAAPSAHGTGEYC